MYDKVKADIDSLAAIKGSKAKQDALAELTSCEKFNTIVNLALDPFKTYGINKLPKVEHRSEKQFDESTIYVLNQLRRREWTGRLAATGVKAELAALTPEGAELFTKIIKKDLKAGFTAKSVNKARPGLVPAFECMLSHKYEEKRIKQWPVAVEEKYDGVRCIVIVKRDGVRFFSRNGKTEFTGLEHIAEELLKASDYTSEVVFDGELVSGSFNDTVSETRKKDGDKSNTHLVAFDFLTFEEFQAGVSNQSYSSRRGVLCGLFPSGKFESVKVSSVKLCHTHKEVLDTYFNILEREGEGVIVKPLDGLYECKRSYQWLKVKEQQTIDVPITGLFQGDSDGKYHDRLGGFLVDVEGVECRIGGGLTDQMRAQVWADHTGDSVDYSVITDGEVNTQTLEPTDTSYEGRVIEVEFHQKTPDGSLRHPRFVRFRDDKDIEDGTGV
ncbi:RNA ligase family protein [Endozoicomonas sp. ALC066]|uniref:ATP-dependent DNA ligase n=1 Tax=Endozoicomonas sp. ALC066 TaxID=3403078 RepID=UPI003BB4EF76